MSKISMALLTPEKISIQIEQILHRANPINPWEGCLYESHRLKQDRLSLDEVLDQVENMDVDCVILDFSIAHPDLLLQQMRLFSERKPIRFIGIIPFAKPGDSIFQSCINAFFVDFVVCNEHQEIDSNAFLMILQKPNQVTDVQQWLLPIEKASPTGSPSSKRKSESMIEQKQQSTTIEMSFFGTDTNVGVTMHAMQMAHWLVKKGKRVAYIELTDRKRMMSSYHATPPAISKPALWNGIDVYTDDQNAYAFGKIANEKYDVIIYDLGMIWKNTLWLALDPFKSTFLAKSALQVMVSTTAPWHIKKALGLTKIMKQEGIISDLRLALNYCVSIADQHGIEQQFKKEGYDIKTHFPPLEQSIHQLSTEGITRFDQTFSSIIPNHSTRKKWFF